MRFLIESLLDNWNLRDISGYLFRDCFCQFLIYFSFSSYVWDRFLCSWNLSFCWWIGKLRLSAVFWRQVSPLPEIIMIFFMNVVRTRKSFLIWVYFSISNITFHFFYRLFWHTSHRSRKEPKRLNVLYIFFNQVNCFP